MRHNKGGARKGAGRKKGIGITYDIQKHCHKFIEELLKNDAIKFKATKQLSLLLDNEITEDYLYIIKNSEAYKIGYSSNFSKRLKSYKTHNHNIELIYLTKQNNCFELENEIHYMFSHKRLTGEWFELDEEELIEIISYCSSKII